MAISDRRFAAEFIDAEGEPFKFDDVACLIDFVKGGRHEGEIVAYFVTDFEDRQWIAAADAHYVHAPELKTPMNGSFAAFRGAEGAREAAARYHGTLLTFDELFGLRGPGLRPSAGAADGPGTASARHDSPSLPAGAVRARL
jgi:copper chaperone NosL